MYWHLSFTTVLRKIKAGYEFRSGRSSANHLLFRDNLKTYPKDQNQNPPVNTVKIFSLTIGMVGGIGKCGILKIKKKDMKKRRYQTTKLLQSKGD